MRIMVMWEKGEARMNSWSYEKRFLKISQLAFDKGLMVKYIGAGVVMNLNKHVMILEAKGNPDGFGEELKKDGYEIYVEVSK